MKIDLDKIQVDEEMRIRKETGDLGSLEHSIGTLGLLNPIIIDENNVLVAGYRRLNACKNLGWSEVEVKQVDCRGDKLRMLDVEVAENVFRKDFTVDEVLMTERRRLEILESYRKKGVWERFWLWLKGIFSAGEGTNKGIDDTDADEAAKGKAGD